MREPPDAFCNSLRPACILVGITASGLVMGAHAREVQQVNRYGSYLYLISTAHAAPLEGGACGNVDGIHKMIQAAKQSAAARDCGAQERDA